MHTASYIHLHTFSGRLRIDPPISACCSWAPLQAPSIHLKPLYIACLQDSKQSHMALRLCEPGIPTCIEANFNCAFCNFPEIFFQTFLFAAWLNPELIESTDAESLGPTGQLCSPGNRVSFPTEPIGCSGDPPAPPCWTRNVPPTRQHGTRRKTAFFKADFSKIEAVLGKVNITSTQLPPPPSNQPPQLASIHLLFYKLYFILFP